MDVDVPVDAVHEALEAGERAAADGVALEVAEPVLDKLTGDGGLISRTGARGVGARPGGGDDLASGLRARRPGGQGGQ